MKLNPFTVLGLPVTATDAEIKARYRKLAFDLHPDRTGDDKAKAEKMTQVNWAYAELSDPDKRATHEGVERAAIYSFAENLVDATHQSLDQLLSRKAAGLGRFAKPAATVKTEFLNIGRDLLKERLASIAGKGKP